MRVLASLIALSLIGACAPEPSTPTPSKPTPAATAPERPVIGMANPASVDCGRKGGRTEIVDTAEGQVGVCVFQDGRRCEEWALFRDNRCEPGPPPARR